MYEDEALALPTPKLVPLAAFPISINGDSILPVAQTKEIGIVLIFFDMPHAFCQQILLALHLKYTQNPATSHHCSSSCCCALSPCPPLLHYSPK